MFPECIPVDGTGSSCVGGILTNVPSLVDVPKCASLRVTVRCHTRVVKLRHRNTGAQVRSVLHPSNVYDHRRWLGARRAGRERHGSLELACLAAGRDRDLNGSAAPCCFDLLLAVVRVVPVLVLLQQLE